MKHPEGAPRSENTQTPITMAEIAKQTSELNDVDAAAEREARQTRVRTDMGSDAIRFLHEMNNLEPSQPSQEQHPSDEEK